MTAVSPGPAPLLPRSTRPGPPSVGLDDLCRSPLVSRGGVAVVELLDGPGLRALQREARQALTRAGEQRQDAPPSSPWDRGGPDRLLDSASGAEVLAALLASDRLREVLLANTGIEWCPLSPQGSYSAYRRPGHHLGLHRDIVGCDLTCVVCCDVDGDGGGGELVVHQWAVRSPLTEVRSAPARGRVVDVRPGQAVLLLGGIVPHLVTPITGTRRRTVAPLCFTPWRSGRAAA